MKTMISFALLAVLMSSAGCSMLRQSPSGAQPQPVQATAGVGESAGKPASSVNDPGPHVRVEFHQEGKKPKLGILPILGDEPMFVTDALAEVQAKKRYPRFTAEVYRPGPRGYERMAVRLENKHRRVPPLYDYALHAGDRLIIIRDNSTALDDLGKSGPLKYLQ